jgi:hypothetical protein
MPDVPQRSMNVVEAAATACPNVKGLMPSDSVPWPCVSNGRRLYHLQISPLHQEFSAFNANQIAL